MAIGPLPPLAVLGVVESKSESQVVIKGTAADGSPVTLTLDGDSSYFRDGEQFRVHFVPLPDEAAATAPPPAPSAPSEG